MLQNSQQCLKLTLKYDNLKLINYGVFALTEIDNTLVIAVKNDEQKQLRHAIQPLSAKRLEMRNINPREFNALYLSIKRQRNFIRFTENALTGDENGVINLVNYIIESAIDLNTSDIHIEPQYQGLQIRYRIDGVLQTMATIEPRLNKAVFCRLKILSSLDISQTRLPQDGHFRYETQKRCRDVRLNICPCIHGEKAVLRLLNPNSALKKLGELGIPAACLHSINTKLYKPQGLILVTGPTGSGKSVTLYAMLNALNNQEKNIVTIENPVEMNIDGITQINTNKAIDLDFKDILRSLLRQDPDIIMIGEIRDAETANIAIRAANTGHLVLATLHTNSASKTIQRLQNMGIAPYQIAHSLELVIAQRLLRKQSNHGYQGRTGVFEVMPIDHNLREMILSQKDIHSLEVYMQQQGMNTLKQAGEQLAKAGITTQQEVHRVLN